MNRVLIIDDEERICDVVKRGLEKMGEFQVSVAFNGKDGIEIARKWEPHLILLDIRMPGLDGMEVLKRLKENDKTMSIPVIMLTAVLDTSTKEECSKLYGELYLEKPVDLAVLKEKIEAVLKYRGKI